MGLCGGSCSCLPPPGVAHRLVSGAGDIKLTKDGNVLLQEMVSREGGGLGAWACSPPHRLGKGECVRCCLPCVVLGYLAPCLGRVILFGKSLKDSKCSLVGVE